MEVNLESGTTTGRGAPQLSAMGCGRRWRQHRVSPPASAALLRSPIASVIIHSSSLRPFLSVHTSLCVL